MARFPCSDSPEKNNRIALGTILFSNTSTTNSGIFLRMETFAVPPARDATSPLKVGFAVEFEVMSDDSDRSDLFGRAISLNGGLLLAGAPKKHLDVPEVQLIVSTGSSAEVRGHGKVRAIL